LIHAIVLCDETGEDIAQLEASSLRNHPKLHLHKNSQRLGMYYNKRKCLEVAPTDWVAVLDSDNIFPEAFFETLMDVWNKEGADPNTIYASGQIVRVFLQTGESEERTAHFAGMRIEKSNWNRILQTKGWNFLLNDGNWVGHRSLLDSWPTDIPEAEDTIKVDSTFRKKILGIKNVIKIILKLLIAAIHKHLFLKITN
jgi:glycosyltransferase involved in cell wall biosynthesis